MARQLVDAAIGPQRDGVADLLIRAAEHRDRHAHAEEQQQRVARHAFARRGGLLDARLLRLRRKIALTPEIEQQTGHHADARGAEAPVPAEGFAQRSADQRREKSADVHADVVDVVGAARARIAGLVQIAIWLGRLGRNRPLPIAMVASAT